MKGMYKQVSSIAVNNEVKEILIKKECDKRITKCKETINKTLIDKFYKELTTKMWTRIANKDLFYVDGEIADKNNKDTKLLIADTTRVIVKDEENYTKKINGHKCRLLTEEEVKFIFGQNKKYSPILSEDGNCIIYISGNLNAVVKTHLNKMIKLGEKIKRNIEGVNYKDRIYTGYYNNRYYYFSIPDVCINFSNWSFSNVFPLPVIDIEKAPSKLEVFFKNNLIPEGFSKDEEELYKECLDLYSKGLLAFGSAGQLMFTDKFVKNVYKGSFGKLAGFSFAKGDVEKFLFNSNTSVKFTEDMEQLVFGSLLDCDFKRAGIDKYDMKILEDAGRGHWDLWDMDSSKGDKVKLSLPLVAKNPLADIHWDGVVGIDFGTKSTVVVYQDGNAHMYPMRIGSGNYKKEVRATDYENPTVMQFIDIGRFMEMYKEKEGRPGTLWEDVNISHTASEALKTASSEKYYSFFGDLKQWCGDKNRQVRIRDTKGLEKTLPAFTDITEDGFNPIELYAYFLGLFINNMHRGIFLDYILPFPVTYEKAVRDKILKSFYNGLWKSLPVQVHNDEKAAAKFRVSQGASEPAAYASCALKEYGFNPEEGEKVLYGIFDFGGGTTDFDFGLWRTPEDTREKRRYDYVIEHFGASGDQYLGGENLLELLAFVIFKNNQAKLREADISFTKPHGCENFPGSETLVKDSQEAKLNTKQLMETVRGLWEHNNPEQIKNIEAGSVKVNLFSNKGERVQNFELKTDKAELEGILSNRIKEGVDNFFNALKLNFARNDVAECDCVNIFLAGNSSKSPIVWKLFEEQIKQRTDDLNKKRTQKGKETDTGHLYYKIFPPLGVTEEDIKIQEKEDIKVAENKALQNTKIIIPGASVNIKADGSKTSKAKSNENSIINLKPTGKTGVAYGLLLCRKGGRVKDVPEKKQDEEAKFKYYLGFDSKGLFNVLINTNVKYGEWTEFIDASVSGFDIYYTSSPNATTNKLPIGSGSVSLKKCDIKEENEEAYIYIRTVAPTVIEYVVATEEGIKKDKYIEEPVRVELA